MYIDVRVLEHRGEMKKHDLPTKVDIRFPVEIVQRFKAGMLSCRDITDKRMRDARRTYKEVKVFLVERDIRSITSLSNECADYEIDHESAVRHKKTGKCKDSESWDNTVDQLFTASVKGTKVMLLY